MKGDVDLLDFFEPSRKLNKGIYYCSPEFFVCDTKDLMIKDGIIHLPIYMASLL